MSNLFHYFANPSRFSRLSKILSPWFFGLTLFFLFLGLWFALFSSPPDYQQGETVRIMYVHVPAAWMSLFIYVTMTILSIFSLIWRHPIADL